jgi:glyoxylase I family protein
MALADGRIFHVNVNCSDLDRSRHFYVDGLGLTEGVRTAAGHTQSGAAFGLDRARWDAWILLGPRAFEGSAIDLLEWQEPSPQGAPPARFETCGFQRLGLVVKDFDAAIERVHELGGAIWSDPFTHAIPGGGEIRLVMGNDPDGTALELIEGDATSVALVAVACADLDRSIAGFSSPAPARAEARPANSIGMWRTALLVADLDDAYRELGRLGVTTISAPTAMAMGPGLPELRFVCFAGPDGEVLELIEQPA